MASGTKLHQELSYIRNQHIEIEQMNKGQHIKAQWAETRNRELEVVPCVTLVLDILKNIEDRLFSSHLKEYLCLSKLYVYSFDLCIDSALFTGFTP